MVDYTAPLPAGSYNIYEALLMCGFKVTMQAERFLVFEKGNHEILFNEAVTIRNDGHMTLLASNNIKQNMKGIIICLVAIIVVIIYNIIYL